jgi:hypothetical protein
MKMEYRDSLLALKEDIEHRGLLDWLEAHTSFLRPLHRYFGTIEINSVNLSFLGTDVKNSNSFSLLIKITSIIGIHLGYDHIFKRIEDRSLGILHFVPLRINFISEGKEESIYVFANYSSLIRHSDNQKLFEALVSYKVSVVPK